MTALYLHGLSILGPFALTNYITAESLSCPVLRRYDVHAPGATAMWEPWSRELRDRHSFERLKSAMARKGMPLRYTPFPR